MEVLVPHNEEERLRALRGMEILDTDADERFDRLTRLVAELLDVPIALVSLVDEERQWFKSRVGLDATETSREVAFCAHAILGDDPLIVQNALDDERFHDNPLVQGDPNIRFYAGAPLILRDTIRLGTLCAIDTKVRVLSDRERTVLQELSRVVIDELTLHQRNRELRTLTVQLASEQLQLREANQSLENFAHMTAHDLRTPLKSIVNLCDLAQESTKEERDEIFTIVRSEAAKAETLVGKYHRLSRLRTATPEWEEIRLAELVSDATSTSLEQRAVVVDGDETAAGDRLLLEQVVVNLLENANKHGAPGSIRVEISSHAPWVVLRIRNPVRAPVNVDNSLFEAFRRDSNERSGAGLGLAIVARIVELHGGQVSASNDADHFEIQVQLPATPPESKQ